MEAILNASYFKATPFSYGAGHIRPNRAMDPGLVYDLNVNDYLNFLCALGYNQTLIKMFSEKPYTCPQTISFTNFNYPSISVPKFSGFIDVTRTLKNVGPPATYKAHIRKPAGITASVKPNTLKFNKIGEEKTFSLTLEADGAGAAGDYVFGELIWSDTKHFVRSPIVVKAA